MRIKMEEFESFAKAQGFKSGNAMMRELGGKMTYRHLQRGRRIGYDLEHEIHNAFGAATMLTDRIGANLTQSHGSVHART